MDKSITKKTYLSIDLFMSYVCPNQMEVFSQLRITDFGRLQQIYGCLRSVIQFGLKISIHNYAVQLRLREQEKTELLHPADLNI